MRLEAMRVRIWEEADRLRDEIAAHSPLAQRILAGEFQPGDTIQATLEAEELHFKAA